MKGYVRWVLLGLFVQVALFLPVHAGAATYSSGFDADVDGWSARGYDGAGSYIATGELSFSGTGGNPDGCLRFDDLDADRTTWFVAPSSLNGDWSANDGGFISFDQRLLIVGSSPTYTACAVALFDEIGNNSAIWTGGTPTGPTIGWVSMMVPIDEASWVVTGSWDALLARVTAFGIKAELTTGSFDVTGIDNVVVAEAAVVPIPGAVWLLGSGLIGMAGLRKKFHK